MAYDFFLKIDAINGDSVDSKFQNCIDVLEWSWGDQIPSSVNSVGSRVAAKPVLQTFNFSARQGSASAPLLRALNAGSFLKSIKLTARSANNSPFETFYLESTLGLVSSYNVSSDSDSGAVENWSIVLANFKFTHRKANQAGGLANTFVTTFDTVKGIVS